MAGSEDSEQETKNMGVIFFFLLFHIFNFFPLFLIYRLFFVTLPFLLFPFFSDYRSAGPGLL